MTFKKLLENLHIVNDVYFEIVGVPEWVVIPVVELERDFSLDIWDKTIEDWILNRADDGSIYLKVWDFFDKSDIGV